MKISSKGRYGLRLMLDLALNKNESPVPLKNISKRQDISEKYLWHLIPPLKKACLINVKRGVYGGITLAKEPEEINLLDIVSVLEGNLTMAECLNNKKKCSRSDFCTPRDVWSEINNKFLEIFRSYSLKTIMEKEINRNTFFSFEI